MKSNRDRKLLNKIFEEDTDIVGELIMEKN
jgi:hypothetical protein